ILSFLNNPENFGKLQELQIDDLKKLNLISSINSLKNILTIWNSNKTNSNESFWQDFFTKNSWVIAQVFSYPVVLFKDKAYVGGKTINNQGGNVVDFIFKSGLIENILLVEIKTPTAKLLGNEYRSTYCLSNELTGSISQLLKYKDEVQKNYFNLNQLDNENFFVFDPQCLLVIGSVEGEKWSHLQKSTFTLQRHNLKNVEVITFDELFKKVEMLIELFEKE
ncbi:MAG: DUF4263 domain-containing protein, partial [Ignavibacteriales bacterium]|nr:DUF4263 domain-containing protein [Ignavibacteriales bacterium]